ncbi:hypothetical protein CAFE_15270 [Caprobacter fermentans]|uniref:TraG P-loop domain-containing protein n=2 Tax=Caproicibacter fermentans TaxID=2576756 RepID=A0A6N8HYQ1_9FIRM|nr:hypothetical protein [Caproicibacter fermentans]
MYGDGICDLGNDKSSATWAFDDTNYSNTESSSRYDTFEQYCQFLNCFDETTQFQIHINTKPLSHTRIHLDIQAFETVSEELKQCVNEYNEFMHRRFISDSTYIQEKYVTVTVEESDYNLSQRRLGRIGIEKLALLHKLGCKTKMLDKPQRLTLLREIYRPDDLSEISYEQMIKSGVCDKDLIAPYSMDTSHDDYIKLGDYYTQTLFLTDFPSDITDSLIKDITTLDKRLLLTINVLPQNPGAAIKEVKDRLKSLDREKEDSLSRQVKMGIVDPKPPRDLKDVITGTENFLNDLKARNEKMFLANILIFVSAKSLEEMDSIVEAVEDKVAKSGCTIKPFTFAQEEGLDSVVPLGRNDTFIRRTFTTSSLAAFIPFNVVEIVHPGGLCYGRNKLSHNIILMDRKRYINAHGFYFGASGSGKTTGAELEMWECFFRTNDDMIIIDPEGGFTKLVNLLGGQVIEVSNAAKTRFNPFDINEYYGGEEDPNPIPFKSDFIISLIEVTLNYRDGIDPVARSVIDRCVRQVYQNYMKNPCEENIPTFLDFFTLLKEQPEPEAKYLASSLEIFIEGSLNIFAGKSNVNIHNRLICFNTKNLGKQLQVMGMSIIQDFCWNLISKNQALHKNTWLWNDEVHLSLRNQQTAEWLTNSWKRGRKYGLIATGMTQEVRDAARSEAGQAMIANSEFIMLYRQKKTEIESISQLMGLSEQQISDLQLCESGVGLFKAGNSIVEFNNRLDDHMKLFQYIQSDIKNKNTRPGDAVAG